MNCLSFLSGFESLAAMIIIFLVMYWVFAISEERIVLFEESDDDGFI